MQKTPVNRQFRRQPERAPFRRGHQKRPIPQCAPGAIALGLTDHVFKPLLREDAACLNNWKSKEREFFNSLSFLANLYGFLPPAPDDHPYPVNIIRALEIATGHVQKTRPYTELLIVQDDSHSATIATNTSLPFGSFLCYIPLQPLDWLWKKPERRPKAELLASVLAYVHQVLRIQTFTDENAWLYWYYDLMRTPEEIEGRDDMQQILEACQEAYKGGKRASKIIRDKTHLRQLRDRIKRFQPADKNSTELHRLAVQAGNLYRLYPNRSIHDSIPSDVEPSEEESMEDYIEQCKPLESHEFLSFWWKSEGLLADTIIEWVNTDLQETTWLDAQTEQQLFDQPQPSIIRNLDFEEKVLDLLDGLAVYLNRLPCTT